MKMCLAVSSDKQYRMTMQLLSRVYGGIRGLMRHHIRADNISASRCEGAYALRPSHYHEDFESPSSCTHPSIPIITTATLKTEFGLTVCFSSAASPKRNGAQGAQT